MSPAIGMVIALPAEASRITGRRGWKINGDPAIRRRVLPGGVELLLGISGPGSENARGAARLLIKNGACALVSAGVSGGLAPNLFPGELVIAESVLMVMGERVVNHWRTDERLTVEAARWLAKRRTALHCGSVITVAEPLLGADAKRLAGETFSSLAVDMESAGVAMAASEEGLPFFILRAVCDPLCQSIPSWVPGCLKADGGIRFGALAAHLLRHPTGIIELLRMDSRFRTACGSLAQAWDALTRSGFPAILAGAPSRR